MRKTILRVVAFCKTSSRNRAFAGRLLGKHHFRTLGFGGLFGFGFSIIAAKRALSPLPVARHALQPIETAPADEAIIVCTRDGALGEAYCYGEDRTFWWADCGPHEPTARALWCAVLAAAARGAVMHARIGAMRALNHGKPARLRWSGP
jgi:hypothetical protein